MLDSKISKGEFKLILPYSFPLIMGNDLAGVVVRVGSGVRHFKPGDEVYARPPESRIGAFAELIAVERKCPRAETQKYHHGRSCFSSLGCADRLAGAG